MSQFFYNPAPASAMQPHYSAGAGQNNSHNSHSNAGNGGHHHHHGHHGGRSRRSNRYSTSQNSHKHFKNNRSQKESAEAALVLAFRKDFEAARSFDLEDDEIFCPWHLLTEDDLHSIHSSSSDRSSSSSGGSPDSSPLQQQPHPTPSFSLNGAAHHNMSSNPSFQPGAAGHLKIHQPLAQRARNTIPIVDPNSRNGSPPDSVSPARQAQKSYYGRRW